MRGVLRFVHGIIYFKRYKCGVCLRFFYFSGVTQTHRSRLIYRNPSFLVVVRGSPQVEVISHIKLQVAGLGPFLHLK